MDGLLGSKEDGWAARLRGWMDGWAARIQRRMGYSSPARMDGWMDGLLVSEGRWTVVVALDCPCPLFM